jgi:large subunit ribosomal protein L13
MKTLSKKFEPDQRKWILVDADGQVLGRLATQIAVRLRGKHLPCFTPHVDTGDFVVVINAEKVRLTGNKWEQKTYYRHTGYMGGLKSTTAKKLNQEKPERLIMLAVKGMLPKNRLGRQLLKKLKVYNGSEHPHEAQNPEKLAIKGLVGIPYNFCLDERKALKTVQ